MSDDREDPIFEACLEEVLGGRRPPDLSEGILRAHAQHAARTATTVVQVGSGPLPAPQEPLAATRRSATRRHARRVGVGVALALACGLAAAIWGLLMQPPPPPAGPLTRVEVPAASPPPAGDSDVAFDEPLPETTLFPDGPVPNAEIVLQPAAVPDPSPARLPEADIVTLIDRHLRAEWQRAGIEPAAADDPRIWCERVFRRLLGRSASDEEVAEFLALDPARRRSDWLTRVLSEPRHRSEFADSLARYWVRVLLGAGPPRTTIDRDGLRQQLARAFEDGDSLATIATRLLTATGDGRTPGDAAANFLLAHFDASGRSATAHTARVFLGQQLLCAECHDHPEEPQWTQQRFWELNAYFRQLAIRREGPQSTPSLLDVDFLGDDRADGNDAPVFFETPTGELKAAYPLLAGDGQLPRSGLLDDLNRRGLLADDIVRSRSFGEAMVNRMWAFLFGYGLAEGAGESGIGGPASHRQLLEQLADQFAARDFQVQPLVRWVALSEAFHLDSRGDMRGTPDAPELGTQPLFSRSYDRPFASPTAVEMLAALQSPGDAPPSGAAMPARQTPNVGPSGSLPGRTPPVVSREAPQPPPVPSVDRAAHSGPDPLVSRILDSQLPVDEKLSHLFLAMLQREPTAEERRLAAAIVGRQQSPREAFEEIWWAVWQSREFASQ